jgi:hypothetical protein
VLGNIEGPRSSDSPPEVPIDLSDLAMDPVVKNLRFGDGELLRNGEGDAFVTDDKGRTLKGRYIVHVGWDDVKGWLSEVSLTRTKILILHLKSLLSGRYTYWYSAIQVFSHS